MNFKLINIEIIKKLDDNIIGSGDRQLLRTEERALNLKSISGSFFADKDGVFGYKTYDRREKITAINENISQIMSNPILEFFEYKTLIFYLSLLVKELKVDIVDRHCEYKLS